MTRHPNDTNDALIAPRLRLAGLALALGFAPAAFGQDAPDLSLDAGFGDHMVLQRGAPITLRGDAGPGEALEVSLGEASVSVTADSAGRWRANFPARAAGGPLGLEVAGEGDRRITAGDILVGDVFLCSGQSNMAWPVSASAGAPWGPTGPDPAIRLLNVQRATAPVPSPDFEGGAAWSVATPETVNPFSGVCWHFAQALRSEATDVPLGLVNSAWGGSRIEPWIPAEGLADLPAYADRLALLAAYAEDPATALAGFGAAWEDWWSGINDDRPWREAPGGGGSEDPWGAVPGDLRNWQLFGPDWETFNGMAWYASRFELTEDLAGQAATLELGPVDEVDVTWINGQFVGGSFGWGTPRRYAVPADRLQAGENTLVVSVYSSWSAGGLTGPAADIHLAFPGGERVPVDVDWRLRRMPAGHPAPPQAPWESIGGLTGLHNAMVAPLGERPLAGALWYQGESNTGEGRAYAALLERLTASWRSRFGAGLPVLVIQLPGFGGPHVAPTGSGWAELRDGQRRVAEAEEATGLVVTLDLGDDFDLHPPHKAEVGRRAAGVYRALRGGDGLADGVRLAGARWDGDDVVVSFDPAAAPLAALGGAWAHGFELCAVDGEGCRFVPGRIEDNTVRLEAGDAPAALLRHCWADAPACNLVGRDRLPVSSFEVAVSPRENP